MEKNYTFFSYVRDGALILAMAILVPVAVSQLTHICIQQPSYKKMVTVTEKQNLDLFESQSAAYYEKRKQSDYKGSYFHIVAGLICLSIGYLLSMSLVSTGLIAAGVICLLFSLFGFLPGVPEYTGLLIILLMLITVLGISYKLSKK